MKEVGGQPVRDWAGNIRTYALAWGAPLLAIIAGLFFDVSIRTVIWLIALLWMGTACLMNARSCGRMHCRFTGPFYLALIIPVSLHGFELLPLGSYAWWILGAVILFGGKIIWWATEAVWRKFSPPK